MKGIYIEKSNSIAYFIDNYKEGDFVEIDGKLTSISESAFTYSDVEKILFKDCSTNIGEKAFEGCEELTTVIFCEPENNKASSKTKEKTGDNCETKIGKSILKNVKLASASGDYVIQANAFKGCGKLATLVLPKVEGDHKFVIEKDAFCGCIALRTVVAICDKMDVTGNPFADSPERLTFVCKKDSDVARFARENGYRSVYVE